LSLIEYGAGGPTIVLQGHMDTVGIDDMTLGNPLGAEIRDGKLWGRGASDMKGGLAAVITALQALHDVRAYLKGRIVFASVVEEECNGSGAGALAWIDRTKRGELFGGAVRPDASGRIGDLAICTDGSGPEVWRGYGGVLTVDVHVQGKSGHPARPGNVSAIEKAILLKEGIDQYKAEREELGPGRNVNLGLFRGGTHPSVVAGSAVMSLNMSYVAADAFAAEKAGHGFGNAPGRVRFEQLVNARAAKDEWLAEHAPRVDWIKDLIPFELPEDHPLVRDLAATHQRVLGQPASVGVNPAWSDACYLSPFGGTPAVVYGAGVAGQAHTAAEYNEPQRIVDCARVLTAFLYEKLAA
ncbi:MAG TPA: M20/M25/M40 family metallo-hydrolase, partial [Chloroflexota bacterium]|nr:M20/M25/M40 family metallo-hydrolase [Chloroflexota bacterium]